MFKETFRCNVSTGGGGVTEHFDFCIFWGCRNSRINIGQIPIGRHGGIIPNWHGIM